MASTAEKITPPPVTAQAKDHLRYSQQLLNVSSTDVTIRAVVSTVVLFGIFWGLRFAGLREVGGIGWLITLFLERSLIQYLTAFAFFAGVWYLVLKMPMINKESDGFSLLDFPELNKWPYGAEAAAVVAKKIHALPESQQHLAVVRRFSTALQRLIHAHDTSEVHDVLNTMSDIDHEIADSSYSPVRFAVWFIPVAGFLGTVLGISQAIAGFAGIVGSKAAIDLNSVKPLLARSTASLGVAFDTTLLALVFSAVLMLVMFYVQQRENVFLSAVDEFCISEIVNKIYVPDPGMAKLLEGLEGVTGKMVESMDTLAGSIRDDFKKLARTLEKRDEERIPKLIETIQNRFERFMDVRDKNDTIFQTQITQLLQHLGNIVERGKAVEGFVAGLGELANLEEILRSNQKTIVAMQGSIEKQQKQMREVLVAQHEQTQEVLADQQKQTQAVLDQNKEAFDRLLQPLKELSTGIKIKVGD